ncbi:MAG: glycosyltransferase family 87 protein [Chloroflexota bacterium]
MLDHLKRNSLSILILALVAGAYTWATWQYFTKPIPGGNDFLTHYGAWEANFKFGYSPYSDEAAIYTQKAIYGRMARPGEDQNRMAYPYYSILVHGPFVLLANYALARAIYMTLLQAALFAGVILMLDVLHWRPRGWLLALLLIWSLLYYPEARGVILGQFAIFGFFSLAAALYLLQRQRDALAGVILTLSTIKPTLVFMVVPFLLLWGIARRRTHFWGAFLITMAILCLGSILALPTWLSEWMFRIRAYSDYTVGQSPVWLLTHMAIPGLGAGGEIFFSSLLGLAMLVAWWLALRPGGEDWFHWALGVTLVVSNLIVPRSATTNYVLMLVTALWVFAALDRTPGWGRPVLLLTWLVSLVGLWWLHIATVVGNQEQPFMFIPMPVVLGLVLLLGYRWLRHDARRCKLAL